MENVLRGCKRGEVEAKTFLFNMLTAYALFGLVLQRYKHSKCHFNDLSRFVLFCPVFVCNKLNFNRRFFETTVNGQRTTEDFAGYTDKSQKGIEMALSSES